MCVSTYSLKPNRSEKRKWIKKSKQQWMNVTNGENGEKTLINRIKFRVEIIAWSNMKEWKNGVRITMNAEKFEIFFLIVDSNLSFARYFFFSRSFFGVIIVIHVLQAHRLLLFPQWLFFDLICVSVFFFLFFLRFTFLSLNSLSSVQSVSLFEEIKFVNNN